MKLTMSKILGVKQPASSSVKNNGKICCKKRKVLATQTMLLYLIIFIFHNLLTFHSKTITKQLNNELKSNNMQDEHITKYVNELTISNQPQQTFKSNIRDQSEPLSRDDENAHILEKSDTCTEKQLDIIKKQLPSKRCIVTKNAPWRNECSFSYASRCPQASWFDEYLNDTFHSSSSFLGISVGCNKGFDAINTIRMGTCNPVFDKNTWKDARGDGQDIDNRCGAHNDDFQFLLNNNTSLSVRSGEMYCIEALPTNYAVLEKAVESLDLGKNGFVVSNAAIGREDTSVYFPSGIGAEVGKENLGLANCQSEKDKESMKCTKVDQFSLQTYVSRFVKSKGIINHLSIDIEGFDVDALYGAGTVLNRTQYLEFEYNWMGSWAKNRLSDTVKMLNAKEFTCYFIGDDELWKISGSCFLDYYDIHMWSNVGCVHRRLAFALLEKMEILFEKTLAKPVPKLNYLTNPRAIVPIKDLTNLKEIVNDSN